MEKNNNLIEKTFYIFQHIMDNAKVTSTSMRMDLEPPRREGGPVRERQSDRWVSFVERRQIWKRCRAKKLETLENGFFPLPPSSARNDEEKNIHE